MTAPSPDQPLFLLRQNEPAHAVHHFAAGCAGVYSARCPGKESDSEDAAALVPYDSARGVLVIADGVGGLPSGALAATLAVQAIADAVQAAATDERSLRDAILNGFEAANTAVNNIGVGAATTLTVVEVQDGSIRPYHVGDSLILLIGQRGKLRLQTVSHSPVGYAVEAGLLQEREAMHHKDRHIVFNLVGSAEMRIEIGPTLHMRQRDTLVIASDGLFDNLHTSEIVEQSRKGSMQHVLNQLASRCHARMHSAKTGQPSKPDDLTFIIFRQSR